MTFCHIDHELISLVYLGKLFVCFVMTKPWCPCHALGTIWKALDGQGCTQVVSNV
jgi:hypothetical protein